MKQVFINIVGHNSSGKSTLAQKLADDLDANIINGDALRELVKKEVKFYKNMDHSYKNPVATSLWDVLDFYRTSLLKALLKNGQSVIMDGSGFTADKRKLFLDIVKSTDKDIASVIVETEIDEEELVNRLKSRDQESQGTTKWLDFYKDIRIKLFEKPSKDEADLVLQYNQDNYSEIIESIRKISV